MKVKRIVANVKADNTEEAKVFYEPVFSLDLVMDLGWIKTFSAGDEMPVEISVASEGGSGTPVPDISIEVDDIDEVIRRVNLYNFKIEYGPVSEPWGVRRFYVRDPFGTLVNVLQHSQDPDTL
ncbi:MAG: VOC family protein [Candidatus Thiodiazotropha sp.]